MSWCSFDDRAYRLVGGVIRELPRPQNDDPPPEVNEEEREFRCSECLGVHEHHPNCPNAEADDGNA